MGRYVYDSNLVTQAIDELNQAVNSLSTINTDIQAGIDTINSATGANCIDVTYSKLLELQTLAEDVIEEDIRIIQEKVTIIEDYESAPWYKKVFASVGMALTKFGEGIVSVVEDLGDGVVSIAGFVGGIFNSEFKASCAEFIEKDHVGDWFDKQYEEGALQGLEIYSAYSKDSIAANIFKGVGSALPYVALSMTGVGLVTETIAAGVSGIGSGTEAGLQKTAFARAELQASLDQQVASGNMTQAEADAAMLQATSAHYNQAFAEGLWQGTKNAALVYSMGKLSQGIQANAAAKVGGNGGKVVAGSADDFAKLTGSNMDDVATTAKKVFGSADDLIAQNVNGRVQLYNAKTFEVVGDITIDGTNAIVRNFANSGVPVATRVLANSGDEILFNTLKNTDDLIGSSFDDLAKAANPNLSPAEKAFTRAGEFGNTKAGQVLNASDDALSNVGSKIANSKAGQLVSNAGSRIVGSKPVQAIVNSGAVQKVTTAVANTVAKHPVATFGVAATAFTADQVGEQQVGSEYRMAQEMLDQATMNPQPYIEPTPTISYETPEIIETPPDQTPPDQTPPGETTGPDTTGPDTTGPGITGPSITGPGITSPEITTPEITTPEITTPEITTPEITTPEVTTPEITTPEITLPGGGDDPSGGTPSGGGGYTGGGYTGEIPETGEGEITLPDGELISDSFTELITGGNEYTKIPTSSAPITTTTTTGAKKSIIPVIAGLSAAAVAGIGTKAYLDKKEESTTEEDFDSEEWTDDSLEVDYNDAMEQDGDYLDPTDEYAYQEEGEPAASYEAVNSSELASMQ